MTLMKKALKNTVEKGENAGNQHCLLFFQIVSQSKGEIVK